MITKDTAAETKPGLTLAERRAFMKLPLAERRRQLAEQAELMIKHYDSELENIEHEYNAIDA